MNVTESIIYKVGFVCDGKSPGEYMTVNDVSVQCDGMFELTDIEPLDAEAQARQLAQETGSAIALIECVVDEDGEILESHLFDTYN